jgi:hypothetical protein
MRLENYLIDEADIIDTGAKGKAFERIFVKALSLVGLEFDEQNYAGKVFDIKSKGNGWKKLFNNKNINIKVYGAKWMFSSSEMTSMLPWDTKKLPTDFNADKAASKVKRLFNKMGVDKVVFLKAKDKGIQTEIIKATAAEDVTRLKKLFQGTNFYSDQLTDYSVRVLHDTERVTSVAADKGGKVFLRSEKPRNIGAGKGTVTVTFRTPLQKLDGTEKPIMT